MIYPNPFTSTATLWMQGNEEQIYTVTLFDITGKLLFTKDVHAGQKHELGEEVADVINLIFAVGVGLGLDIEKEFLLKEDKNNKRSYKRANEDK